jgi:hypothetical protein
MGSARRCRRVRQSEAARVEIPIALVVEGSTEVVTATREVARSLRAIVRVCSTDEVALLARQWRAFAIVLPWTASDSDAALFDALTRASGAQVIGISTVLPSIDALRSAMTSALELAREGDVGSGAA